jgi:hypothetical protein
MPNYFEYVDGDTYIGWDSKVRNMWYEDNSFLPCWLYTNCLMTMWKSRVRLGTIDPKMRIPAKQISIIMASLEMF